MSKGEGVFDSFRVEEAYNWRDDIMEITRRIVHETDEARLNNIAEHFKVDLSEIREFFEMKRKKMKKPQTNADRFRAMSDEELAYAFFAIATQKRPSTYTAEGLCLDDGEMSETDWLSWLKSQVEVNE